MSDEPQKRIVYRRVVDLSHPIGPDIPVWPGDPAVGFDPAADLDSDGYFLRRFSMGEHSGTHLASPATFQAGGAGPDDLPASSLILPAVVIDVSVNADRNHDYTLAPDDVQDWERRHGRVPAGAIVLLHTGWHRYWGQPDRFINQGDDRAMHTPGFSADAATLLLERRGAAGLGTDTHGIDAGTDAALRVSRMALARSALVLECLNNLDELPPTGATIFVGRLRLVGGSGSPASVIALIP